MLGVGYVDAQGEVHRVIVDFRNRARSVFPNELPVGLGISLPKLHNQGAPVSGLPYGSHELANTVAAPPDGEGWSFPLRGDSPPSPRPMLFSLGRKSTAGRFFVPMVSREHISTDTHLGTGR